MTRFERLPTAPGEEKSALGLRLRRWRQLRGKSQLDLALEAGISARNLSFVETGRTRPKQELIVKLARVLDIPLREQNVLLQSAGLPALYQERDFGDTALQMYRDAIRQLIQNHSPCPAYVVNRWGDVIETNATAQALLPPDATPPFNLYESFLFSRHWPQLVENWNDVAWAAYFHLREDANRYWGDERMQALLSRVYGLVQALPGTEPENQDPTIHTRLRLGNEIVETTTMVARFGNSQDLLLSELSVEMIFPANETARRFFETLAGSVAMDPS